MIGSSEHNPPRLEMQRIAKRFGATVALDGVDLRVEAGQVLALVGENGAGKSTLMKVLAGAIQPDAGTMFLDGQAYAPRDPLIARRRGVAMIYQELSLAPHLSVEENILLGMEPTRLGVVRRGERRRLARRAIEQLAHPDLDPDVRVDRLGVAAQQLVEIARALVIASLADQSESRGGVIVLDEPTSSLGHEDAQRLFKVVRTLRDAGHAIIYISHFIEELKQIADRFTVLRDGKSVGGGAMADADHDQIVRMMVGRELTGLYPKSNRQPGEVVLELDRLAGVRKPRSASLALRRGEVLGIAGLVGAGRTEMLRALFGLDPVRSGRIQLKHFAGPATPTRRLAQGAGLLSEDRKAEGLALNLSIAENTALSSMRPIVWPARQARGARRWIERLGVRCASPTQPISSLSGGNQQKVALARLLEHGVDVLLLDEPTRGIDVGAKATIYQLIDELAQSGKAVLIVSSYLPELMGVCDRVAVMCRGVLSEARPTSDWTEQQIMNQAIGRGAA